MVIATDITEPPRLPTNHRDTYIRDTAFFLEVRMGFPAYTETTTEVRRQFLYEYLTEFAERAEGLKTADRMTTLLNERADATERRVA